MVDSHPRFHLEALRWYASLTENAGVDPGDLVAHTVGSTSSDVLEFLRSEGVSVRRVDAFDSRSPHCNKISGALSLAEDGVEGMAVLCDTDVVMLEDPRGIDLPHDSVAGKVVDAPLPPLAVLLDVFSAAGLSAPPTVPLPWEPDERTVAGNANGGLYLVPGPVLPRVAAAWARWASWLLDRIELLQTWAVHVDQVSMTLAMTSESIAPFPLDVRWNTPTHDPSRIPPDPPQPKAIHYHWEADRRGLIRKTGVLPLDQKIDVANDAVRKVWTKAAPERTFAAWLSELASEPLDDELKTIVASVADVVEPTTVLEIGVGSGLQHEVAGGGQRHLAPTPDALGARFESEAEDGNGADLVICLDQLTSPLPQPEYRELLRLLWRSTRRALVIRGYEDSHGSLSPGFEFSGEPLSASVQRLAPEAEVYPVHVRGALATFVLLRAPKSTHPRDFPPATLAPLVGRHPDPLGLLTLRLHARQTTRFYPDHAPRLWEYPVVARLFTEQLPAGSRIVDVGAGVSPLAPFLASRGYVVDTVDPSPNIRTWPPQPDWNEWDYLDYGAVGLAHRSWNSTLREVPTSPPFDGVYSVSVIEHIPATARRALLADISTRTRRGGLVVLTIDLVPGSEALWNLNLEVEVDEDLATHGSLQDVRDECAAVGLELFHQEVVRDWGGVRVDIGLLALRQTQDPQPEEAPAPPPQAWPQPEQARAASDPAWRSAGRRLLSRVRGSRS